MKFLCKRGGSSGASSSGGGGAAAAPQRANTPSGVTYNQFLQMSDTEKYKLMDDIINDTSIVVPRELDSSVTSKIIYALGMTEKPTVVSDSQLDAIKGRAYYRTVNDYGNMSASEILNQIKSEDYTQLASGGGTAHGRALYFANTFVGSQMYGSSTATMMRVKLKPTANIVKEDDLVLRIVRDASFGSTRIGLSFPDSYACYAIAHGIDGWYDKRNGYLMMVNRGALVASSVNKKVSGDSLGRFPSGWKSSPTAP